MNATGHVAVLAIPSTGKVKMLGKKAQSIHTKYSRTRKRLQRHKRHKLLAKTKRRESNIVKDLNHKISKEIVRIAKENNCGIKLEDLTGIRKTTKSKKSFRYTLNSWSFFQLKTFISYKAKKLGVPVLFVDPHYTSQRCSICGNLGTRNGKTFHCKHCGHTTHADINAAFNIAVVVGGRTVEELSRSVLPVGKTKKSKTNPEFHRSLVENDTNEGFLTANPHVAIDAR